MLVMLSLKVDFYKYGSFKNTEVLQFYSRDEILEFIEESESYTDYLIKISEESGENCNKWTQKFEFEGVKYNLAADC